MYIKPAIYRGNCYWNRVRKVLVCSRSNFRYSHVHVFHSVHGMMCQRNSRSRYRHPKLYT